MSHPQDAPATGFVRQKNVQGEVCLCHLIHRIVIVDGLEDSEICLPSMLVDRERNIHSTRIFRVVMIQILLKLDRAT